MQTPFEMLYSQEAKKYLCIPKFQSHNDKN